MHPFVFLPGTLCDERLWTEQVERVDRSFVADLRKPPTLEAMIDAVAGAPFDRFVLVGFSMGGYVAQEFALRHPERVERLVLVGSSAEGYPAGEKELVTRALPQIEKGLFQGLTERRLREFLHPKSFENTRIREKVRSMAGRDAGQVYARQLRATLERRKLSRELSALPCPLHLVAGREDRIVPLETIERLRQDAPRADIHVLNECGHFVPLEKAKELGDLLVHWGG